MEQQLFVSHNLNNISSLNHNYSQFSYYDEEIKILPGENSEAQLRVQWKDLFLKPQLLKIIKQTHFQYPSQVQKLAIVKVLSGSNVICQAKSGTGKTAVFVLSILNMMTLQKDGHYLPHQCLIMVPTRQLAHQIYKQFLHFNKYITPNIPVAAFFGGIPIESNVSQLCQEQSPAIIISTPGRLNDLHQRNYIILSNCKYFILDECDKILENQRMKSDFCNIYHRAPSTKQSLMFSATVTNESRTQMLSIIDKKPIQIKVQKDSTILNGLTQFFIRISEINKFERLSHLLDKLQFNQCIIFVNRINKARRMVELLRRKFFYPITMHSSLRQDERIFNYDLFRMNSSKILVATDLFGRGLDIQKVNLVINYDFPRECQTYLHRVGRAGRFGAKGIAINFLRIDDVEGRIGLENQSDLVRDIKKKYECQIRELPQKINILDYL